MPYNVPSVPGVPALLGGVVANAGLQVLGAIADIAGLLPDSAAPQWGIFLDGVPVVTADTVASIDYNQEWVIADFPIEEGGFESYDKVSRPFDVRFRFASGGDEATRAALLDSIAAIAGTLELFTFASPEAIYQSVCVSHYDYRRTATQGVGLLVVDVWGWQVVINTASGAINTQAPDGADPSVGGAVTGTAASGTQIGDVYTSPVLNPPLPPTSTGYQLNQSTIANAG